MSLYVLLLVSVGSWGSHRHHHHHRPSGTTLTAPPVLIALNLPRHSILDTALYRCSMSIRHSRDSVQKHPVARLLSGDHRRRGTVSGSALSGCAEPRVLPPLLTVVAATCMHLLLLAAGDRSVSCVSTGRGGSCAAMNRGAGPSGCRLEVAWGCSSCREADRRPHRGVFVFERARSAAFWLMKVLGSGVRVTGRAQVATRRLGGKA